MAHEIRENDHIMVIMDQQPELTHGFSTTSSTAARWIAPLQLV